VADSCVTAVHVAGLAHSLTAASWRCCTEPPAGLCSWAATWRLRWMHRLFLRKLS
jgi:hypothetical protein